MSPIKNFVLTGSKDGISNGVNRTITLLSLVLALTLTMSVNISFAQESEKDEIIFTTYYPAPYGVYNEFKANRVVVGEDLDTEDLKDGELQVGSHIILKPQDDPPVWASKAKGGLYYDDDDDEIKYSDGLNWNEFGGGIPEGVIVMWSGTIANIPFGWALCDGNNGTPDLRDRFIYGVSAGQNPGATGGATSPTISTGGAIQTGKTGRWMSDYGANYAVWHYHTIDSENLLPPYYKLAFIMKL